MILFSEFIIDFQMDK